MTMEKDKIEISHLQFADNTILFSNEKDTDVSCLMGIVNLFWKASRLKTNQSKQHMLGINIDEGNGEGGKQFGV